MGRRETVDIHVFNEFALWGFKRRHIYPLLVRHENTTEK